jgi:hypothetical protein
MLGRWISCPACGMKFAAMPDDETGESESKAAGPVEVDFATDPPPVRQPTQDNSRQSPPDEETTLYPDYTPQHYDVRAFSGLLVGSMIGFAVAYPSLIALLLSESRNTTTVFAVLYVISYLIAVILLMAWVAQDARARGVDGGAVWVFLMLVTGVFGLLIYMASRPHGILIICEHCMNRKLALAKMCPHCGHAQSR